jgi:MbtH protein
VRRWSASGRLDVKEEGVFDDEEAVFRVVVNDEEQYSIWPADRDCPAGWKDVGRTGKKAECLAYIREVWTDMRPLSLRKQLEKLTPS